MSGCWRGPVANRVVFGGGGAVAVRTEVKSNPFDAVEEEVAFLGVEGEAPFGEDVTDTLKVKQKDPRVVAEEEDVVDNLSVAGVDKSGSDQVNIQTREFLAEQSLPFLAHEEHEDSIAGRGVNRPKRHDVEGVEGAIGTCKCKFLPVGPTDANLVETRFGVNTDPIQASGTRGKVVNGFVAAWDRKTVHKCNRVEAAVGDTEAPDEVFDILYVFLMGFWGKDNHGEPAGEARKGADPSCVKKGC